MTLIFNPEDIVGLTAKDVPTFLRHNRHNKDLEIWVYVGEHAHAGMAKYHTLPEIASHEHSTIKKYLDQGKKVFKVLEVPCLGNDRVAKAKALEAFILTYLEMRQNWFQHLGLKFKLANRHGEYDQFYKKLKKNDLLFDQAYSLARAESRPLFCLDPECKTPEGHKKEGYEWSALEHFGKVEEVKFGEVV